MYLLFLRQIKRLRLVFRLSVPVYHDPFGENLFYSILQSLVCNWLIFIVKYFTFSIHYQLIENGTMFFCVIKAFSSKMDLSWKAQNSSLSISFRRGKNKRQQCWEVV